jgi:hypothetical protein
LDPAGITFEEIKESDYVVTVGCSTLELDTEDVDISDWSLDDPNDQDLGQVRTIRDDRHCLVERV